MVGTESLIAWALGDWGGPGSSQTRSLAEWIELCAEYPEEHLACYDGSEIDVTASKAALRALGFPEDCDPVAYRRN
jgi:hypothetical protein